MRRKFLILLGILALASIALALVFNSDHVQSDVPVHEIGRDGHELVARYADAEKKVLLITRSAVPWPRPDNVQPTQVFQFDTITHTLSPATIADWKNATEVVTTPDSCAELTPGIPLPWDYSVRDEGLYARVGNGTGGRVATTGKHALEVTTNPTADRVAVVTTDGRKRAGTRGWFIAFGGGYGGQHYVEIFGPPSKGPLRKAIRIPFRSMEIHDLPVWTSDGRLVIFSGEHGSQICIIPTEEPIAEAKTDKPG